MKKLNYNDIKEYIENQGYKLISKSYKGCHEHLEMICPKGHNYKASWTNFKAGKRCDECDGQRKLTYDQVKNILNKENYELLQNNYQGSKKPLKVKCPKGHITNTITMDNFINKGCRCKECIKNDYNEVKNYIESFNYKLISNQYIGSKEKLEMICPKGHKCFISYHNFKINNQRCKDCNISKGEELIKKYLDDNNIKYIREYIFKDCKDIHPLPFDFYISSLNILIEYDGEQHYNAIDHFGGNKRLEITKNHDLIKTKYCKENNYNLIRIPYWEKDNIFNILNKEINNKESSTTIPKGSTLK